MPKVSEIYTEGQKKYPDLLSSANLGLQSVLTIKAVHTAELKGKKKMLVGFEERPEELVLNVTNSQVLASRFGDDSDLWAGKKVHLFVTQVPYQSKMVPALRIAED